MDAAAAPGTSRGAADPPISDVWPRVLLSPVLGVLIPNISGLIDHSRHGPAGVLSSYLYFAAVAFVIWEGNRRIYFRLQQREDWLRHPWRRVARLLGAIALYTVPAAALLLWIWRTVTGDPGTSPYALPMGLLAIVTAVTIITHGYETVFLLHDWETDRLRQARAEQARLQAELDALGREVDPHFLFNSLNALVHLVEQRSDAAVPFVTALGEAYRYVLEARGRALVPLASEIGALRRHETLARIQHGGRVDLTVDVDEAALHCLLPPVTLGELFQNAIKHNAASDARPLRLTATARDRELVFENDLRPVRRGGTTGIGLANLAQRVRLTTGREITWGHEGGRWVVRVPLAPPAGDGPVTASAASPSRP